MANRGNRGDEFRNHYDFSGGVRGKYASRFEQGRMSWYSLQTKWPCKSEITWWRLQRSGIYAALLRFVGVDGLQPSTYIQRDRLAVDGKEQRKNDKWVKQST